MDRTKQAPMLLRITEVAEQLGLARSTAYELARTGELPTVRIGKSVRVPLAALHRWIAARTNGPDLPSPDAPAA